MIGEPWQHCIAEPGDLGVDELQGVLPVGNFAGVLRQLWRLSSSERGVLFAAFDDTAWGGGAWGGKLSADHLEALCHQVVGRGGRADVEAGEVAFVDIHHHEFVVPGPLAEEFVDKCSLLAV